MSRNYTALAVITLTPLLFPSQVSAEPRTFVLDHEHLTIAFMAQHLSFASTLGVFLEAEGTIVFDEEVPALQSIEVSVATESVETHHARRDNHLRSGDFLNVSDYPEMTFSMTGADQTGETTGTVTGNLTLIGETRPITLDVTLINAANYPYGDRHYTLGISARGSILRSEWGMTYGIADGLVGDEVEIIIEAELIRQD